MFIINMNILFFLDFILYPAYFLDFEFWCIGRDLGSIGTNLFNTNNPSPAIFNHLFKCPSKGLF